MNNHAEQYDKKLGRLVDEIVRLSEDPYVTDASYENTPQRDSGHDHVGEVMRSLSRYIVAQKHTVSPDSVMFFTKPPYLAEMKALKEPLLPLIRDMVEIHQRKLARGMQLEHAEFHLSKAIQKVAGHLLPQIDELAKMVPPEEFTKAHGVRGALFAGITAAAGLYTRLMQDLRKDASQGRGPDRTV